jgi:hypothetical protein
MEAAENQALDQLHEQYMAARAALKEAERRFTAVTAGLNDMPAALNTRRDCIELTGSGVLTVNPPPAGPPWAQPATPPSKQVITRKEFARIDTYIEAFADLKRKQEQAERLYNSLPELDRQLGSKYRSPLEP